MKVGDLVTLSWYATNLEHLWRVQEPARKGELVGLLVNISESKEYWMSGTWYTVRWFGEFKDKKLCRSRWNKPGMFKRKDLKMYKRPKAKE
jgi:hypothetical protein